MERAKDLLRGSGKVFVGCGFWLIGLGAYVLFLRPALLSEDLRFIGSSLAVIRAAALGVDGWLGPVFNVMDGVLIATGSMTVLVALTLRREPGARHVDRPDGGGHGWRGADSRHQPPPRGWVALSTAAPTTTARSTTLSTRRMFRNRLSEGVRPDPGRFFATPGAAWASTRSD